MSKKIIPLIGYALIKQDEVEEKTASGIYVPAAKDEKPQQGVIIALNEDDIGAYGVEQEDIVVYKKWGAEPVEIDGEEFQILKIEDILAVIKEEEDN